MIINFEKCLGCGICIPYCPGEAIVLDDEASSAKINQEKCLECQVCLNSIPCLENAFEETVLSYGQSVRKFFNNPKAIHKITSVPGRGTEESKTNDVTDKIKDNEIGLCIELGRPVCGTQIKDISIVTEMLTKLEVSFEKQNPLYSLMDKLTGRMPENLFKEKLLSAIIEIRVHLADMQRIMEKLLLTSEQIQTVFSLGIIVKYDHHALVLNKIKDMGLKIGDNAKINLGFGKMPAGVKEIKR